MKRRSIVLVLGPLLSGALAFAQTPMPPPTGTTPTTPTTPTNPDGTPITPAEPVPTEPTPTEPTVTEEEDTVAQDLGISASVFTARVYGYIAAIYEKSAAEPSGIGNNNETLFSKSPAEWDVTNFHVMIQGNVFGKYRYFMNLAAPGAGSPVEDATIGVRNAWIEFPLYRDLFNFRIGKTYRRFGLYNEVLDAVPTFIGIEPPEMFDGDHLMLTRTTNAMLHGKLTANDATIAYALATGNDERAESEIPMGADLRFTFQPGILLGGSFYTTNGDAVPSVDLDGGNPIGGVANWMEKDDFKVYSVFGQLDISGFTLQLEYTAAVHEAVRDPGKVEFLAVGDPADDMDQGAGLFPWQLQRFFTDPNNPSAATVRRDASYTVRAAYVRAGYDIKVGQMEFIPYGQFDYYVNKEEIANEDFGGDNEAGLSDSGVIYKSTLGLVFRPARFIAVKFDGSLHSTRFNGTWEHYPEIRSSFSLYWELGDAQ
ncbi:MAG: hypothetical protein ACKV2T_10170 [Kofleriaceae bacterium]